MGVHLPRWVWIGAVVLAGVAGMVNVIGFLGFEHQAISHLTGTTCLLGAALVDGDLRAISHLWGDADRLLPGGDAQRNDHPGQRLATGTTLWRGADDGSVAAAGGDTAVPAAADLAGALLAAMACGLQNAMVDHLQRRGGAHHPS